MVKIRFAIRQLQVCRKFTIEFTTIVRTICFVNSWLVAHPLYDHRITDHRLRPFVNRAQVYRVVHYSAMAASHGRCIASRCLVPFLNFKGIRRRLIDPNLSIIIKKVDPARPDLSIIRLCSRRRRPPTWCRREMILEQRPRVPSPPTHPYRRQVFFVVLSHSSRT